LAIFSDDAEAPAAVYNRSTPRRVLNRRRPTEES
jgi:hypothetical protein